MHMQTEWLFLYLCALLLWSPSSATIMHIQSYLAYFSWCYQTSVQILDTQGTLLTALGYGLWPSMVILSEIIQTFILADFCYYYAKWYVPTFKYPEVIHMMILCISQEYYLWNIYLFLVWFICVIYCLQPSWWKSRDATPLRCSVTY